MTLRKVGRGASAAIVLAIVIAGIAGDLPGGALDRFAQGARSLLVIVVPAVLLSLLLGVPLGLVSARIGRIGDRLVTRGLEVMGGFPTIVLVALLRGAVPDASAWVVMIILSLVRLPETIRLVRVQSVRFLSSESFVGARAIGAGPIRVFFVHLVPGMAGALGSTAVVGIGIIAGVEAAMEFLGMDTPRDAPSWGSQIGEAVAAGAPGGAVLPAAALTLTLVALAGLAEVVRGALDPRDIDSPGDR